MLVTGRVLKALHLRTNARSQAPISFASQFRANESKLTSYAIDGKEDSALGCGRLNAPYIKNAKLIESLFSRSSWFHTVFRYSAWSVVANRRHAVDFSAGFSEPVSGQCARRHGDATSPSDRFQGS